MADVMECNVTPGEPTISVTVGHYQRSVPVGCSAPRVSRTSRAGTLRPTPFPVTTGIVGPAALGQDSAGNDAAVDAASYPCPPAPSQTQSYCVIEVLNGRKSAPSATLGFSSIATTCVPVTSSAPGNGTAVASVFPGSCLQGGTIVQVTASGLNPDDFGALLECNLTPNQPKVYTLGSEVPVGCTPPENGVFTSTSAGTLAQDFTIGTGTIGPPATGTDSSGGSATADAANYPCPPTSAQVAAGNACGVVLGDEATEQGDAGDQVVVPITFASG
jgi:hypothetical protein